MLKGLNIRPFRVDIGSGVAFVPKNKVAAVKKLCKHFDWPIDVKVSNDQEDSHTSGFKG